MAKILTIDEMLATARNLQLPALQQHVKAVQDAGTALAADIARHLNINHSAATFEGLELAGTCSAFTPAHPGQPLPEVLREFDPDADWE